MNTLDYILAKYQIEGNYSTLETVEIPNVDRNDLAKIFNELGFKVGIEVGVERGYYSEVLCKANPDATIYGVDPWESLEMCINNQPEKRTQNHSSQNRCNRIFNEAKLRLSVYPNYKFIKSYSIDAANQFADNSVDFVYIDANHEYTQVLNDLRIWERKIRPGGVVSGHDYYDADTDHPDTSRRLQVKQAVDYYVKRNGIKPLIIWGATNKLPGTKRDRWRSWMFIKK